MEIIIQGEATDQLKNHIKKVFDLECTALAKAGVNMALGELDYKGYKTLELDEKAIKLDEMVIPVERILRMAYSPNAIRIDYYLNKDQFWSGTIISSGDDAKRIWLYLCALSVDMEVIGQIDFKTSRK